MKGRFVVITGPSAAGKSKLANALIERIPHSSRLVTVTTRTPRPNERDGIDYHFATREEFAKRLEAGEFFEHAEVYGNLYGSSRSILEKSLERFSYVFVVVDIQGAKTVKAKIPEALVIFISPGSLDDILRRIERERTDALKQDTDTRVETAIREMRERSNFDREVENIEGAFEDTVEEVMNILIT